MIKLLLFVFLVLMVVSSSCSLAVNATYHSELAIFEHFFKDFRSMYAYAREYTDNSNDCSTDELYDNYRPHVSTGMGYTELARIFARIKVDCADPHFAFIDFGDQEDSYRAYWEAYWRDYQTVGRRYDSGLSTTYLQHPRLILEANPPNISKAFEYGMVQDASIGYVRINDVITDLSGSQRLSGNLSWLIGIERIIDSLNPDTFIVDIRTRLGGSFANPVYIAQRFMDNPGGFMRYENITGPGEFTNYIASIKPAGVTRFSEGKVILLTDDNTCSGGEILALAMRKRRNLIHVGSNTWGCPGFIAEKDLPNGWQVRFTSSRSYCMDNDKCALDEKGNPTTNYLRWGIKPDVDVTSSHWQEYINGILKEGLVTEVYLEDTGLVMAIYLLEHPEVFTAVYEEILRHQ